MLIWTYVKQTIWLSLKQIPLEQSRVRERLVGCRAGRRHTTPPQSIFMERRHLAWIQARMPTAQISTGPGGMIRMCQRLSKSTVAT